MKRTLALLLLSVAAACSSPTKIPDNVMGVDKMKIIVWDMQRAATLAQNQFKIKTDTLLKGTLKNFEKVLIIHKISKEDFFTSYNYYLEHPDKHKILMDSVIAYANRKRMDFFKKAK